MPRMSYKERYFEHYKAEKRPSRNGKHMRTVYVYTGVYTVWTLRGVKLTHHELVKWKIAFAGLLLLATGLYALAALPGNYVTTNAWCVLPGALRAIALLFELIGVGKFAAAKERMTELDAQDISKLLRVAPLCGAVCAIAAAATGTVFSLMGGMLSNCALSCAAYLLSGGASLAVRQMFQHLKTVKVTDI